MDIFVESCKRQYHQTFKMLRQALELCPDGLWAARGDEAPFWQQTYHTLLITDGYATASFEKSGGPHVKRILAGMREPGPDEPPFQPLVEEVDKLMDADHRTADILTREETLDYLEVVATHCDESLDLDRGRGPVDPASNPFPWTGETAYDKHIYNLRHLHHHLGRLNALLRRRGGIGNPWVIEDVPRPW